jgi:hypothetical protein
MDQFDIGRLFVSSVNKTVQVGGVLLDPALPVESHLGPKLTPLSGPDADRWKVFVGASRNGLFCPVLFWYYFHFIHLWGH